MGGGQQGWSQHAASCPLLLVHPGERALREVNEQKLSVFMAALCACVNHTCPFWSNRPIKALLCALLLQGTNVQSTFDSVNLLVARPELPPPQNQAFEHNVYVCEKLLSSHASN